MKTASSSNGDIQGSLIAAGFSQVRAFDTPTGLLEGLGISTSDGSSHRFAQVDLVILDGISQLKDFEVIGAMRRNYHYQDVPIIVTSESKEPEFVQMMFAFGANDYLVMPFHQVELIARVRSCLKLKHETDRRQARERELLEVSKQLAELNSWLARLSLLDGLTRISNRRAFDETLEQEWKRAIRNKSPLTLFMLDVDNFKQYNDAFGHQSGDACLKKIADAIKATLNRPADFLSRYGGDEFAILLPDTHREGALFVGERIKKCVEDLRVPHANSVPNPFVTVTLGGASWLPRLSQKIRDFVQNADGNLYQAKQRGRNCVEVGEGPEAAAPKSESDAA